MRRLSAALVIVVLVAGCSGGSAPAPSPSTTAGETPVTTAATPATTAETTSTIPSPEITAEKEAAAKVVIQAADAGTGFTSAAHDASTDVDLGPCIGHDPVLSGTAYPTQANGPDLTYSGELAEIDIQSSVRVAPTVAAAQASMAALQGPDLLSCLTELLRPTAPSNGITVSSFSLAALALSPVGDDLFAYKASLVATESGTTVDTTADTLFIRTGMVISQLSVVGINVIPTSTLVNRLATILATRARAIA